MSNHNSSVLKLEKVMTLQRGYDLPAKDRRNGIIPVISSSGISGYHDTSKCHGENVITGRYGTIGEVFYYTGDCWPLNTTLYVKDFHGNDPQYIYYLLKNVLSAYKVDGRDKSTVPGIDRNVIHQLDIHHYDDKIYQKDLCAVLKSIDELFDNNLKICLELESMAKTLYDYWFTQFDFPNVKGKPYRTSGGAMEWNKQLKREIPKGWIVGNLYRIADYINGLACQKYRPKDGEGSLPVIKITEMHGGITNKTETVSESIPDKYKIYDGDILFSWSATLEIMYWFGGAGGLNQHIFKVVPKEGFPKEYVYQQLSAYIINFVKMAEARKTTMGHITTDHLDQSRIAIPPTPVLERFSEIVRPIHEMIGKYQQQNRELTKLRDWLLPMLMNGQAVVE